MELLTEAQVDRIYKKLSDKQKFFIDSFLKKSKKSKWLEILARKKGIVINKDMDTDELIKKINDWVLVDVLDSGKGNRNYKCECGTALRYQYIVEHKSENKLYKLGSTCIEHYTKMSPQIIKDIERGFHSINLERDELLFKIDKGYKDDLEEFKGIKLPEDVLEHLNHDMPLLKKQLTKLYEMNRQRKMNEWVSRPSTFKASPIIHLRTVTPSEVRYEEDDDSRMSDAEVDAWQKFKEMHGGHYSAQSTTSTQTKRLQSQTKSSRTPGYQELMRLHLDELREIRRVEQHIPSELKKDWEEIQRMVLLAKKGQYYEYHRFTLMLLNLKIPLKLS